MAYNPNLFSVTNVMNTGQPASMQSTMVMTQPSIAPNPTMASPNMPQPSWQPPPNQIPSMTTVPQPSAFPNMNGPHGGIISVNPNATVVQYPDGRTQMLNPSIGYTGLANTVAPPTISPQIAAQANMIDVNAPAPVLMGQPNPQGNQIPNYYNIQNTPSLQAMNSFVENVPNAARQCDQNTSEAAQQLLQAQHRTSNLGPLGMGGITSNEYLTPRRTLYMNRPNSNQVFPPMGIPGNGPRQPVVRHAMKNVRNHQYCPEMYMTPYDRTPNKIATGVLTNPYTGEVFQTFEEGMPLPQKNNSLLPSQLKQTNPKLVQLQGGIDFNAPPPSKQEIAENVPLINGGPNLWGDALYQPQLRQWFEQRAVIDQFNNRNGILPTDYGINKERPAGFVGDVNMLRPVGYNPATNRNTLDLKGWTLGVNDGNLATNSTDYWNVIQPTMNHLDPNRGQYQTFDNTVGVAQLQNDPLSTTMIYDADLSASDLRATMKTLQENPVPVANVQPDQVEGYIYNPPDLKATLKVESNTYPYVRVGQNPLVQDGSVYQMAQDTDLKSTNKALFQVPVPIHNVSPDLPHTEIDLTAPSEKTETRRQYYSNKGLQAVANVSGEGYTTGVERGPQPYAEWTRVAKRGGANSQQFRVVPNRVTDSLSNEARFSPGCSERDIYPEQPNANMMYGSFVRPSYGDYNAYQQTDFASSLPRPLPATSHCFKKGDNLEQDTSRYTLQPMALSMVGSM